MVLRTYLKGSLEIQESRTTDRTLQFDCGDVMWGEEQALS